MARLLFSSDHTFQFFSWINFKCNITWKSFKIDRSAIHTIFIFMHKRVAKFWIVLFHSNKTLAFSFYVPIILICHFLKKPVGKKKIHCFPKSFQSPLREYLLQKQCEDSNKCCTWMEKIKCPQKLCSRLCPDKGTEEKVCRKAFLSQWREKNKIIFQAITRFYELSYLKKIFYSFLWESCGVQEDDLQCLGSRQSA